MKAVWLFAGGSMQITAAKKIKGKGYKLILTDGNSSCECLKYTDEFIELDTFDINGNIEVAKKLKKKYDIRAVFTVAADCHETVANVAKFLNLPGIDPAISHLCRFKLLTREILLKNFIYQPKFMKIRNIFELIEASKKIRLPAVLKATNNSGSRGFIKIENQIDLTEENLEQSIAAGTTGYAIFEKLLVPIDKEIAEQSVETLWYNGKMYWLNWVDRLFRQDFLFFNLSTDLYENIPWGIEIGHINPAIHQYEIKKKVYRLVYKAGIAIGMRNQKGGHILKADIMLTNKGPCIIELTPRLSGGWDSSKTTPNRGADFIGGAIGLALGEELDLDLWFKYFCYKNPNLFSTIMSKMGKEAKDCIGRRFAEGSDFDREKTIKEAYMNLMEKRYVI